MRGIYPRGTSTKSAWAPTNRRIWEIETSEIVGLGFLHKRIDDVLIKVFIYIHMCPNLCPNGIRTCHKFVINASNCSSSESPVVGSPGVRADTGGGAGVKSVGKISESVTAEETDVLTSIVASSFFIKSNSGSESRPTLACV